MKYEKLCETCETEGCGMGLVIYCPECEILNRKPIHPGVILAGKVFFCIGVIVTGMVIFLYIILDGAN